MGNPAKSYSWSVAEAGFELRCSAPQRPSAKSLPIASVKRPALHRAIGSYSPYTYMHAVHCTDEEIKAFRNAATFKMST